MYHLNLFYQLRKESRTLRLYKKGYTEKLAFHENARKVKEQEELINTVN